MKITGVSVEPKNLRYVTAGDWIHESDGGHRIEVGDTRIEDYNFLLFIHELVESWVCKRRGITDESVLAFDKSFKEDGEPGADINAPYRREHFEAETVERVVANILGVDWHEYEKAIEFVAKAREDEEASI